MEVGPRSLWVRAGNPREASRPARAGDSMPGGLRDAVSACPTIHACGTARRQARSALPVEAFMLRRTLPNRAHKIPGLVYGKIRLIENCKGEGFL